MIRNQKGTRMVKDGEGQHVRIKNDQPKKSTLKCRPIKSEYVTNHKLHESTLLVGLSAFKDMNV